MDVATRDELRRAVEAWLAADPDPETRVELAALLDADDEQALRERFAFRLPFGTAGIRGPLGAGPARMNRVLVRRVTAGLAAWLPERAGDAASRGVVVGRDTRHKSAAFAWDTARVLAGAGLTVHWFPEPVPTPLLAFAVRELDAAAGVEITASHNPPADNGYKVYTAGGAPLRPPADAEIDAAVEAVELDDIPLADEASSRLRTVDEDVTGAYVARALCLPLDPDARGVRLVYTPLHGVAGGLACRVLDAAGFTDLHVVAAQAEPDPDFPTLDSPNPEHPGALDAALALGRQVDADLVLATDPDGDRLGAAVPDPGGGTGAAVPAANGAWRVLSGDEIGGLLADHLLSQVPAEPEPMVATTVVSSRLLARVAEARGAAYAETLTGFKWLAAAADEAERAGRRPVLAYEQALGFMVGDTARDKDGMTAALVLADLAGRLARRGEGLSDALETLARCFGLHATRDRSLPVDDPDAAVAAVARLRRDPPTQLAGVAVSTVSDHAAGVRRLRDGAQERLTTPPTELLGLGLADESRVLVRPSGTEPLLKWYLEVVEPVAADETLDAARRRADARLDALEEATAGLPPS